MIAYVETIQFSHEKECYVWIERKKNSAEWVPLFGVGRDSHLQEPVALAQ